MHDGDSRADGEDEKAVLIVLPLNPNPARRQRPLVRDKDVISAGSERGPRKSRPGGLKGPSGPAVGDGNGSVCYPSCSETILVSDYRGGQRRQTQIHFSLEVIWTDKPGCRANTSEAAASSGLNCPRVRERQQQHRSRRSP
ncbi:hypothetical protein SKAU_G00304660 [Synaphobranchus kaupii]|uniref:Uncharacterized protein n=1 Tax=Synaphobranchus kaupii TaxID=118154 RepID=A0A9Q1INL8_SYNKA|nr:hypothetical protein SKAU_G00304660 [Synaphobranchus kaupii]